MDVVRRESYVPNDPPVESGPLGPAPLGMGDSVHGQSLVHEGLSLEEQQQQIEQDERYLQKRLHVAETLLEDATRVLAQEEARYQRAVSAMREMTQNLQQLPRHTIFETCEMLRDAEVKFEQARGSSMYLRTQIELVTKALSAIEAARNLISRSLEELNAQAGAGWNPSAMLLPSVSESFAPYYPPLETSGNVGATNPVHQNPATPQDLEAIFSAREYERRTIWRRIDARIFPALSDAGQQVEYCETLLPKSATQGLESLAQAREQIKVALLDVRMLHFELEPSSLNELGLVSTIQRYVQYFVTVYRANILTNTSGGELRFDSAIEHGVFRVARELIANALFHSRAKVIDVAIHQHPGWLTLTVQDDGCGFEARRIEEHCRQDAGNGIGQIQLEATRIGGQLGVESKPGKGTRIDFVLDLRRPTFR